MRVLIASGGSGGHIFPALSVAEEIKDCRPDTRLLFVCPRNRGIERFPLAEGCSVYLPAIGMPRKVSMGLASFTLRLAASFARSFRLIATFRPHVAVGFGNFASFAPLVVARSLGIPVAIHEANAVPGKANLLLSRLSDSVMVHFPAAAGRFPTRNVEVVGMPLRKEFTEPRERLGALANLKLSGTKFTLLVIGGSQGATALNAEFCTSLDILQRVSGIVQVIHLTGKTDYGPVKRLYDRSSLQAYVARFEHRAKMLYDAADFVVARAGASTVAEIVHTGKPAILVPFPYATDHHQDENARYLEENGGAVVLRESPSPRGDRRIPGLVDKVLELVEDKKRLQQMADSNRRLANEQAARKIADVLFRIARREAFVIHRVKGRVPVPA